MWPEDLTTFEISKKSVYKDLTRIEFKQRYLYIGNEQLRRSNLLEYPNKKESSRRKSFLKISDSY